jgi:molecular chaperone GrpE
VADFENLQKITQREKQKAKDYAIESFAKDIIANMDILHLALKHVPEERRTKQSSGQDSEPSVADNLADLYTGVSMTANHLEKTLNRFNIKSFDPTGEKFNPNLHEALYQAPIPGKEPGTVLECSKKGWMLKDRVLRAAEVGVVMEH